MTDSIEDNDVTIPDVMDIEAALEAGYRLGRETCCDLRYYFVKGESSIMHYADTPRELIESLIAHASGSKSPKRG